MVQCTRCRVELDENLNWYASLKKRGYNICIKCYRQDYNERYFALREEMIAAYGGKCECCGDSHHEFLTIDHIYGGGSLQRRKLGILGGAKFYEWLKQQGWPKDKYQLLCWNCNQARGRWGQCPHKRDTPELRGEKDRGVIPPEIPFSLDL